MSTASSSVVSDQFPAGLRVLVVDDDPTCLMILEKMLRTCLYEGILSTFTSLKLLSLFIFLCLLCWQVYANEVLSDFCSSWYENNLLKV